MAKKLTPEEQVKAARAAHRAATLAALPPVPNAGGAYVVSGDGALVRETLETPSKEA